MLEIGNGGQTEHEYRSHFAIWSMMSAPLMAGNDIRNMDALTKEILLNKEAIAINQDKLGKTAFRFVTLNGIDILVKALSGGDVAFLFVNRNNFNIDLDYNWNFDTVYDESLENGSLYMKRTPRKIKNIWTQQEMGTTDTPLRKVLEPHESLFVRLRK